MLEKLFHLKEHQTDVKTEVLAGITTFLSMAYILAVNPNILGHVMNQNGVFMATAIASAVATFIMGIYANYPLALSAGMGLNAYFAFTVCMGELKDVENPFKVALAAVLVEGIIFILMSLFKFREAIVNGIPQNLKYGITTGIGLFIATLGLTGAGVVVSDESTVIAMGSIKSPTVALALIGFLVVVILAHFKLRGAVLLGILVTWGLGMIAEAVGWYQLAPELAQFSVFPDFSNGLVLNGLSETAFQFDFGWAAEHLIKFITVVFSFLFLDLFDTVGTVVGVAEKANLMDEQGRLPRAGRVFMADAVGTTLGACLGTSTITSFMESTTGVGAGGRTGLTAVTTGFMFLISIFLAPVFLAIPSFATAPALIYVGLVMFSTCKKIRFDGDPADAVSAFVAIVFMVMTQSISNGIMYGVLAWGIVKICTGKIKDFNKIMVVISLIFVARVVAMVFEVM